MEDLRIGMIGLNEGNGHPFSYSAIFNGYDPEALKLSCPFALIRDYLPREHRNEVFLEGAKVTHLWTQDLALSEKISRVSRIPHVVTRMEDLIGVVDAVILARDDPWNHLAMARPFLEAKVPLFIDKQLASTSQETDEILRLAGPEYPLMAGSSARYTRDLQSARGMLSGRVVRSIHGMSRVSWMRYGHHLFEPIACLFGLGIDWVRSLCSEEGHDIVQIHYHSGLNVILEFVSDIHLPIQFTCFSEDSEPLAVPFTDFFYSFREMLRAFVNMVHAGQRPFPRQEMIGIAHVILAGDLSKRAGGIRIEPATLRSV